MRCGHGVGRCALVAGASRQLDGDAAGRLAPPAVAELRHLGALAGIELAAARADEHLQSPVALGDRDRMPLTVVVGNVRCACGELLIGVARDQKHGAAADQGRARHKSGR